MNDEQKTAMSDAMGQNIQTLTSHLKDLMKIISYLTVMQHVDMERPLGQFMKEVLGLDEAPGYMNSEAKLKHVKHVWLLLKFTQTDSLMKNDQVTSYPV